MASNAYCIFGTLSTATNRLSDQSDLLFVRTADNTWNQVQDYYAFTDINTGNLIGYSIGGTAPVSGTDTFTPVAGGAAITYDDTLHVATPGANNGALDDINSAIAFDKDTTTIQTMNGLVGGIQSASDDRGVEFREVTAVINFPAI